MDSRFRRAALHGLWSDQPVCESFSTTEMISMIDPETRARIRHLFYAAHWKVGTIARELRLHADAVRLAVETERFNSPKPVRTCVTDPYTGFIREILTEHPRLRATRVFQMIRDRGYPGSVVQLRRVVATMRPVPKEAFLSLRTFPGEQGQVDWANFGEVPVGRARRPLSCFVITLSYSRALYFEFSFDQRLESFLRGHTHAFDDWEGLPGILLCDNLRSVVLERRGDAIHFHPRLLELCAHYHCSARPCQVRAAICEALERKTPRASSVAFILNQRQRSTRRRTPSPVDLSRHPELEN
jgi:transposase